jgi:hypothetical protein
MHKYFYSNKDSWISDISSSQNFGGDEVLELHKAFSGDSLNGITRTLVHFDVTEISKSVNLGIISTDAEYRLKMYSTETAELPANYEISGFALSQSWEEGTGKLNSNPALQDGVTWENYDHRTSAYTWDYDSTGYGTSGSSTDRIDSNGGGGIWFTGSKFQTSQNFSYESTDIDMDVTELVHRWITGSYSSGHGWPNGILNNGLLLKYSGSYESSSAYRGDLKFFSSNTHTIYSPKLEVKWNDSDSPAGNTHTGSVDALNMTGSVDNFIYVKRLRDEYRENEIVKFRVGSRKKYVGRTFDTSVQTLTGSFISTGSGFYSIKDIVTDETIIPFGAYSSMSIDSEGNYFKQDLNTFQPNRVYKILLKINYDDGQEHIIDDDYTFKVVR